MTKPESTTVELHSGPTAAPATPGPRFGSQLAEATQAPATPTTGLHAGFDNRLTSGAFQEMLAIQRPSAETTVDDPDVDVTGGPGIDVIATGQASAAVESAPDLHAGTYLALPPDCRPTVPFTVP